MKMTLRIIIIVLGAVVMSLFLIPTIRTGNIHIGAVTVGAIGAALLLYGIFFDPVNRFIAFFWHFIAGKAVLLLLSLAVLAILTLAGMCIVSMARTAKNFASLSPESEGVFDIESEDLTVIVLGCTVYPTGPSRLLTARLDTALEYLNAHPSSSCIVCGGQGKNEPTTEADAMYDYLTEKGISPDRILKEDRSTDTAENFKNAYSILKENDLNPHVVVVTNDFHMYRALKLAEKTGFADARALPAETAWWLFVPFTVREMYGILEMWFL